LTVLAYLFFLCSTTPVRRLSDSLLSFTPVPVRRRRDGWTPERQVMLIAFLRLTGCIDESCRRVGRSRESAYKLYRRPDAAGFRAAWDAALDGAAREPARLSLPPILSTSALAGDRIPATGRVPAWSLLGMMAALASRGASPRQSSTSSTSSTSGASPPTVNFHDPSRPSRVAVGRRP
jgi:hypothetical protein